MKGNIMETADKIWHRAEQARAASKPWNTSFGAVFWKLRPALAFLDEQLTPGLTKR